MRLRQTIMVTVAFLTFVAAGAVAAQTMQPPGTAIPAPSPAAAVPAPSLPPAAVIPASVTLDVTGAPAAEPAYLEYLIRGALDQRIRPTLAAGASIQYGPIVPWPLLALFAGTRAAVNVTVKISGDGSNSADVGAVTTVILNSVELPPLTPAVLFLSDDPEYLTSEGLVFRGAVDAGRPARLYYYHSDIGVPRDVDIVLTAAVASRVHLVTSAAGPDLDVRSVGHSATRDFLRFQRYNEGVTVSVTPETPFVVRHALLLQGEVIAGVIDAAVVGGGAVAVSVVASAAGSRPDRYLSGPRVPFDGNRRHGAFDLAGFGNVTQSFTVGGPPATVQYGTRSRTLRNLDPNDDGHDYGDYGVVHKITFLLSNTTDLAAPMYLYEKPLGGPVSSSFLVDGQLKELGCARVPQPYWIATYQLIPHSQGASTTITMPDGGSFYPLEFGVTSVQPASLPDGCVAAAASDSGL